MVVLRCSELLLGLLKRSAENQLCKIGILSALVAD